MQVYDADIALIPAIFLWAEILSTHRRNRRLVFAFIPPATLILALFALVPPLATCLFLTATVLLVIAQLVRPANSLRNRSLTRHPCLTPRTRPHLLTSIPGIEILSSPGRRRRRFILTPNTQQQSRFVRACLRQPVDRTPVWFLRQAGRYMPEYMAVRKHHSLLEICRTAPPSPRRSPLPPQSASE